MAQASTVDYLRKAFRKLGVNPATSSNSICSTRTLTPNQPLEGTDPSTPGDRVTPPPAA